MEEQGNPIDGILKSISNISGKQFTEEEIQQMKAHYGDNPESALNSLYNVAKKFKNKDFSFKEKLELKRGYGVPLSFKETLALGESRGEGLSFDTTNSESSAYGPFQVTETHHKERIKSLYGADWSTFQKDPKLQEKYMDVIEEDYNKALPSYKNYPIAKQRKLTDEQVKATIHVLGSDGAKTYLQTGEINADTPEESQRRKDNLDQILNYFVEERTNFGAPAGVADQYNLSGESQAPASQIDVTSLAVANELLKKNTAKLKAMPKMSGEASVQRPTTSGHGVLFQTEELFKPVKDKKIELDGNILTQAADYLTDVGSGITGLFKYGTLGSGYSVSQNERRRQKELEYQKLNKDKKELFKTLPAEGIPAVSIEDAVELELASPKVTNGLLGLPVIAPPSAEEAHRKGTLRIKEHTELLKGLVETRKETLSKEELSIIDNMNSLDPEFLKSYQMSDNMKSYVLAQKNLNDQISLNEQTFSKFDPLVEESYKAILNARQNGDDPEAAFNSVVDKFSSENPADAAAIKTIKDKVGKTFGLAEISVGVPVLEQLQETAYGLVKTAGAFKDFAVDHFGALTRTFSTDSKFDKDLLRDLGTSETKNKIKDIIINNPNDASTSDLIEELVKVGDRTLVLKNGKVDKIRDKDGNQVYYPTKQDAQAVEQFGKNPEKYERVKDVNFSAGWQQSLQIGTDMVPMIAAAAATGGGTVGMMLGSATVSFGDYYEQALAESGDISKAGLYAAATSGAIGYVESKIGKAEALLGRAFTGAEKSAIIQSIEQAAKKGASKGVLGARLEGGFMQKVKDVMTSSQPILKEIPSEIIEELTNPVAEGVTAALFDMPYEAPSEAEYINIMGLTTLVTTVMGGLGGVASANKENMNSLISLGVTNRDGFKEVSDAWVQSAKDRGLPEAEITRRQQEVDKKSKLIDTVGKYYDFIKEESADRKMSDEKKNSIMDLAQEKALLDYKADGSTSTIRKDKIAAEAAEVQKKLDKLVYSGTDIAEPIVDSDEDVKQKEEAAAQKKKDKEQKTQDNAIQEQKTTEVPVQPETPSSGTNTQGQSQPESQGTTQQSQTQEQVQGEEVISDSDYNTFVNDNVVPPTIIETIAQKVKQNETLSLREQAILAEKGKDVESALKATQTTDEKVAEIEKRRQEELDKLERPSTVRGQILTQGINDKYDAELAELEKQSKQSVGDTQTTQPTPTATEAEKVAPTPTAGAQTANVDLKGEIEGSAYILKNYRNAKKYPDLKVGDVTTIPIQDLMPRIGMELGVADAKPKTEGPISVNILSGGTLQIVDGHNRFKKALLNGDKDVEIKIVKSSGANVYDSWYNRMAIKAVKEGRISAQDAKEIIEKAGLVVPKEILEQVTPTQEAPTPTPTEQTTTNEQVFTYSSGKTTPAVVKDGKWFLPEMGAKNEDGTYQGAFASDAQVKQLNEKFGSADKVVEQQPAAAKTETPQEDKATEKEVETLLEPIGKTPQERENQIFQFFALAAAGGDKTKAREIARVTNNLWENVAKQLGKRSKQAAEAWIQAKVALIGKTSVAGATGMGNAKFQLVQRILNSSEDASQDTARRLLSEGKNRDDVFALTGWYQNDNGELLYEIDDVKLKGSFDELFEGFDGLQDGAEKELNIEGVIEGPILERYPELKGYKVILIKDGSKEEGQKEVAFVDFGSKTIGINYYGAKNFVGNRAGNKDSFTKDKDSKLLASILAHELQHATQFFDGRNSDADLMSGLEAIRAEAESDLRANGKLKGLNREQENESITDWVRRRYADESTAAIIGYRRSSAETEARVVQARSIEKVIGITDEYIKERENAYTEVIDSLIKKGDKTAADLIVEEAKKDSLVKKETITKLEDKVSKSNVKFQADNANLSVQEAIDRINNNLLPEIDRLIKEMSNKDNIKKRGWTTVQAAEHVRGLRAVKAQVEKNMKNPKFQVDAYHGTPYVFDKFTTDKIGTGEGVQAFGWGLYFTDLKSIAEGYAKQLSTHRKLPIRTVVFDKILDGDFKEQIIAGYPKEAEPIYNEVIKFLKDNESYIKKTGKLNSIKDRIVRPTYMSNIPSGLRKNIINDIFNRISSLSSNVYKVSLHEGKTPDQYNWLEWDKELSQKQIQDLLDKDLDGTVAEALTNHYSEFNDIATTKELVTTMYNDGVTGKDLYKILERNVGENPSPKDASISLLNAGIDGIKYPAESISRGATADTARGSNYVVFDENAVTIKERVQFQQDAAKFRAATIELANNQVILAALDSPNESSFVHEMAHSFESDLLPEEKQTFIDEYNELFGEKEKGWSTDVSEYFARVWEKYLSNGRKLTSAEVKDKGRRETLQEVFDKFTDWLQGIYNGVIEYNNSKGVKKEITLSPAAQAIFDNINNIKTQTKDENKKSSQSTGQGQRQDEKRGQSQEDEVRGQGQKGNVTTKQTESKLASDESKSNERDQDEQGQEGQSKGEGQVGSTLAQEQGKGEGEEVGDVVEGAVKLSPKYQRYVSRALATPSIPQEFKDALLKNAPLKVPVTYAQVEAFAKAVVDQLETLDDYVKAAGELVQQFAETITKVDTDPTVLNRGAWEITALKMIEKRVADNYGPTEAAKLHQRLANVGSILGQSLRQYGINDPSVMYVQTFGRHSVTESPIYDSDTFEGSDVTHRDVANSLLDLYESAMQDEKGKLKAKIAAEIKAQSQKDKAKDTSSKTDADPNPDAKKAKTDLVKRLSDKADFYLDRFNSRLGEFSSGFDIEAIIDYTLYAYYKTAGSVVKTKRILEKRFGKETVDTNWDTISNSENFKKATLDIAQEKLLAAIGNAGQANEFTGTETSNRTPAQMIIQSITRQLQKKDRGPVSKKTIEEVITQKSMDIDTVSNLRRDINGGLLNIEADKRAEVLAQVDDLLAVLVKGQLDAVATPWVKKTLIRQKIKESADNLGVTVDQLIDDIVNRATITNSISEEFLSRTGMSVEDAAPYIKIIEDSIESEINQKVKAKAEKLIVDSYGKNIIKLEEVVKTLEGAYKFDQDNLSAKRVELSDAVRNKTKSIEELREMQKGVKDLQAKAAESKKKLQTYKTRLASGQKDLKRKVSSKTFQRMPTVERVGFLVRNGGLSDETVFQAFAEVIGARNFTQADAETLRSLYERLDNSMFQIDKKEAKEAIAKFAFEIKSDIDKQIFVDILDSYAFGNMLGAIKSGDVALSSGYLTFLYQEIMSTGAQISKDIFSLITGRSSEFANIRLMLDSFSNMSNTNFSRAQFTRVALGKDGISLPEISLKGNESKGFNSRLEANMAHLDKMRSLRDRAKEQGNVKSSFMYNAIIGHAIVSRALIVADYVTTSTLLPYKLHRNLTAASIGELTVDGLIHPSYNEIRELVASKMKLDEVEAQLQSEGLTPRVMIKGESKRSNAYHKRKAQILYEFLQESDKISLIQAEHALRTICFTGKISGYSGYAVEKLNKFFNNLSSIGEDKKSGEKKLSVLIAASLAKLTTIPFPGVTFRVAQFVKNSTPFGVIQLKDKLNRDKSIMPFKFFDEYNFYNTYTGEIETVPATQFDKEIRWMMAMTPTIAAMGMFASMFDYDDEEDKVVLAEDTEWFFTTGYSPAMARKMGFTESTYEPYTAYKKNENGIFERKFPYRDMPFLWFLAAVGRLQEKLIFDQEESLPTGQTPETKVKDPLTSADAYLAAIRSVLAFSTQGSISSAGGALTAGTELVEGGNPDVFVLKKMAQGSLRQFIPFSALQAEADNYYSLLTQAARRKGVTAVGDVVDKMIMSKPFIENYEFDVLGEDVVQRPSGPPLTSFTTGVVERLGHAMKGDIELKYPNARKVLTRFMDIDKIKKLYFGNIGPESYKATTVWAPEDPQIHHDLSRDAADLKGQAIEEDYENLMSLPKMEFEKKLKKINDDANESVKIRYAIDKLSYMYEEEMLAEKIKSTKELNEFMVEQSIYIDSEGNIKDFDYLANYEK